MIAEASATRAQTTAPQRQLPHGALHVWAADLDALGGACRTSVLSDEEMTRALQISWPQAKRRWIAGRIFLRALLGEYIGEQPRRLRLIADALGKPMLADATDLRFNLSHCGPHAVCALTRMCAVGVDVQLAARPLDVRAIARRAFGAREAEQLSALSPAQRVPAFLRAWTAFEAERKRIGAGIARPSERYSGPRPWLYRPEPRLLGLSHDAACTVALAAPPVEVRVHRLRYGWLGAPAKGCGLMALGPVSDYWTCSE